MVPNRATHHICCKLPELWICRFYCFSSKHLHEKSTIRLVINECICKRPSLFNCQIPILKDTLLLKYSIWFPNFRWLPIVIPNFTSLEQWIILPLKLKLQFAITLITVTVDWNLPRSTFLELNLNEFNTFWRSIKSISF